MPVIEATELTKTYGELRAVDAISFAVSPGESFGLLGPNGAGTSTTMRMIGGTTLRTSGTLTVKAEPHLVPAIPGFRDPEGRRGPRRG